MSKKETPKKNPLDDLKEKLESLLEKALKENMDDVTFQSEVTGIVMGEMTKQLALDIEDHSEDQLDAMVYDIYKRFNRGNAKPLKEFTKEELQYVLTAASNYDAEVKLAYPNSVLDNALFAIDKKDALKSCFIGDHGTILLPETIITIDQFVPGFNFETYIDETIVKYFSIKLNTEMSYINERSVLANLKHGLMTNQIPDDWLQGLSDICFRAIMSGQPFAAVFTGCEVANKDLKIHNRMLGTTGSLSFPSVFLLFVNWVRLARILSVDLTPIHNVVVRGSITYGVVEDITRTIIKATKRAAKKMLAVALAAEATRLLEAKADKKG